jgi:hypothetical protein
VRVGNYTVARLVAGLVPIGAKDDEAEEILALEPRRFLIDNAGVAVP